VSQIITSLDPSPRRSLSSKPTPLHNASNSDQSDPSIRNDFAYRKLSLPPSPPVINVRATDDDSTPVPRQAPLLGASFIDDSPPSEKSANELIGLGLQEIKEENGGGTVPLLTDSRSSPSASNLTASPEETENTGTNSSNSELAAAALPDGMQGQVGLSEEETEIEGHDLESEGQTPSYPSGTPSEDNGTIANPPDANTAMAGVLDEGVFGAVDPPRKSLRHRRSKSHDFASDSLTPTHLIQRTPSAEDILAQNEEIASPLDELIRELGGRRQSASSSRSQSLSLGSQRNEFLPDAPTDELPRTDSSDELQLTVEEMDREIQRMERELAEKHQKERQRQLLNVEQSRFSASTIAQSDDGRNQPPPPTVTIQPASNGPPSTPPPAVVDGITPRRATRWSIVELEASYGRMKDLLASASKPNSEGGPMRSVSPSVVGDGEAEDLETAFERARKRLSGGSFDIDVLDPDLTKLLRYVFYMVTIFATAR
jgi:hypothetical protein